MSFREPSFEEMHHDKKLKPEEQSRYYRHSPVVVEMDEKYFERLQELREKSKQLNKAVQASFEKRGLPFSTKETHLEPIKVTFHFRPQFVSTESGVQESAGKAGERFNTASDEVAIFFHLDDDFRPENDYFVRQMSGMRMTMMMIGSYVSKDKDELREVFDINNITPLAEFIADRLSHNHLLIKLTKANKLTTLDEATKYLGDYEVFGNMSYYGVPVRKNLVANVIRALLKTETAALLKSGVKDFKEVKLAFSEIIDEVLSLPVSEEKTSGSAEDLVKEAIEISIANRPPNLKGKKKVVDPENVYQTFKTTLAKEANNAFRREFYKKK